MSKWVGNKYGVETNSMRNRAHVEALAKRRKAYAKRSQLRYASNLAHRIAEELEAHTPAGLVCGEDEREVICRVLVREIGPLLAASGATSHDHGKGRGKMAACYWCGHKGQIKVCVVGVTRLT